MLRRSLERLETCTQHEMVPEGARLAGAARDATSSTSSSRRWKDRITGTYLLLELADATQRQRISRDSDILAGMDGSRLMIRQLAHEVKNPLGGLRGAAQLLERELTNPALHEYTAVIIAEADRLSALVDSMAGSNRPPQKSMLNVHEICEHVLALLRAEAPASVQIERDYDPSLPDGLFDRNQMVQALLNVARNALQAVGIARPRHAAHARAQRRQASARCATGSSRSSRSRTTAPACRRSWPRRCSCRWSPVGQRHRAGAGRCAGPDHAQWRHHRIQQPAGAHRVLAAPAARGHQSMSYSALRVWLVDDDASIRWVLERALKNAGMTPRLFEAAESALVSLRTETPDVLMTDIRMSGQSGLELLQARARPASGPAGDRDDGAFGPRQRRVGLRERCVRVPAQALRHRPGRGAGAPRRTGRGEVRRGRGAAGADVRAAGSRAGDAAGVPRDRPPVAFQRERAGHRRIRHRQGAGGARAA